MGVRRTHVGETCVHVEIELTEAIADACFILRKFYGIFLLYILSIFIVTHV